MLTKIFYHRNVEKKIKQNKRRSKILWEQINNYSYLKKKKDNDELNDIPTEENSKEEHFWAILNHEIEQYIMNGVI